MAGNHTKEVVHTLNDDDGSWKTHVHVRRQWGGRFTPASLRAAALLRIFLARSAINLDHGNDGTVNKKCM